MMGVGLQPTPVFVLISQYNMVQLYRRRLGLRNVVNAGNRWLPSIMAPALPVRTIGSKSPLGVSGEQGGFAPSSPVPVCGGSVPDFLVFTPKLLLEAAFAAVNDKVGLQPTRICEKFPVHPGLDVPLGVSQ
jgi:hypothetical protein